MTPKIASLVLSASLVVTAICLAAIIVWPLTLQGAATLTAICTLAVAIGYYASNRL